MKIKKVRLLIITILAFLLILLALGGGYTYLELNKIKTVDFNYNDSEIGIEPNTLPVNKEDPVSKEKVKNILLLGIDNTVNADTMIVLSIDNATKKIKLTSLMRDSYIYLGQCTGNKLNYAYHSGGVKLAVQTINENFNLDIRDYILVDFDGLKKIIDALGGVEINVLPEEIPSLNSGEDASEGTLPVTYSGIQVLNGNQALSYCRIRNVGNYDYQRTERQRTVLIQLLNKMKNTSVIQIPQYIDALSGYTETSISKSEMIILANTILSYSKNGVEENRVPYDNYKYDYYSNNGIYYMQWNRDETLKLLHEFIYEK